jgi:general secretion pathway protein M
MTNGGLNARRRDGLGDLDWVGLTKLTASAFADELAAFCGCSRVQRGDLVGSRFAGAQFSARFLREGHLFPYEGSSGILMLATERRDALSHLEARVRSGAGARARTTTTVPAAAFLDAATAGLAAAQLQAYLSQVAASQQAILISYGVEAARREGSPDSVLVQTPLDVGQKSLQDLLYQLESQTPYVFVDLLAVQPPSTAGQRAAHDPTLRLTLSRRALWRRGSA